MAGLPLFLDPERAAQVRRNLRSIYDIPLDLLPHGPARSYLSHLAAGGEDVYAYLGDQDVWCIWLGPLGRGVTVAEWTLAWQQLAPQVEYAVAWRRRQRVTAPLAAG
jgi:hypothetical protein